MFHKNILHSRNFNSQFYQPTITHHKGLVTFDDYFTSSVFSTQNIDSKRSCETTIELFQHIDSQLIKRTFRHNIFVKLFSRQQQIRISTKTIPISFNSVIMKRHFFFLRKNVFYCQLSPTIF